MAISVIQNVNGFYFLAPLVATSSFGTNPTVGNFIVVHVSTGTSAADVSSVTDTYSNTYTKVFQYDNGTDSTDLEIWIAKVTTTGSGFTVSAHDTNSNLWFVSAYEVSGLVSSSWLDKSAFKVHDASGGAQTTTFSTSTANTPDLILQANIAIGITGSNTFSLSPGFSNLSTYYDVPDGFGFATQVQVASSTGTFATTIGFTGTASVQWDAIMVALKGTSSGPPPSHVGGTGNMLGIIG